MGCCNKCSGCESYRGIFEHREKQAAVVVVVVVVVGGTIMPLLGKY